MNYISTREGVEKIDNTCGLLPATVKQKELIADILSNIQTPCIALLITRTQHKKQCWGNPSDDNVEDYAYDYRYSNDKALTEAKTDFIKFLNKVFEKDTAE